MIGRKKEVAELLELYDRDKAELVAVYGRRRVGKTFLVDETFKDRITFRHAGLSPIEEDEQYNGQPLKKQLQAFYYSLMTQGMKKRLKNRRIGLMRFFCWKNISKRLMTDQGSWFFWMNCHGWTHRNQVL